MTIDFHTHIFPDSIADKVVEDLRRKASVDVTPAGNGSMRQLMQQMEKAGIDKAVLCPIVTKPDQFESILNFSINIGRGAVSDRAQQVFIPFASVHPDDPNCFEHLEKIAESGIKGIKFHPFYQDFSLGSPHAIDIMRCCRDLDLIVVCHCGQDTGFPEKQICTPLQILKLHEKADGIKFIASHLGGWRMWKEVRKELLGEPIFMDISVLEEDMHSEDVQILLHEHPAEKLLSASDWPWCPLEIPCETVRELNISNAEKEMILGGNAERLLGYI